MYEQLLERLPHRAADIHYIPYGIPLPPRVRRPAAGPAAADLRRAPRARPEGRARTAGDRRAPARPIDRRHVDDRRRRSGRRELRAAWPESSRVRYRGALTNAETIARWPITTCSSCRRASKGLPVALLEAMGCGVVPVVSNIDSGVPEVVTAGVDRAAARGRRRRRLRRRDRAARRRSRAARALERRGPADWSRSDSTSAIASTDYQALYARYAELYRPLPPDARCSTAAASIIRGFPTRSSAWCARRFEGQSR